MAHLLHSPSSQLDGCCNRSSENNYDFDFLRVYVDFVPSASFIDTLNHFLDVTFWSCYRYCVVCISDVIHYRHQLGLPVLQRKWTHITQHFNTGPMGGDLEFLIFLLWYRLSGTKKVQISVGPVSIHSYLTIPGIFSPYLRPPARSFKYRISKFVFFCVFGIMNDFFITTCYTFHWLESPKWDTANGDHTIRFWWWFSCKFKIVALVLGGDLKFFMKCDICLSFQGF